MKKKEKVVIYLNCATAVCFFLSAFINFLRSDSMFSWNLGLGIANLCLAALNKKTYSKNESDLSDKES